MAKIIIYTQAYNAEKTLGRTIESVLGQTRADFAYYVLDNGSNDRTGEIIADFAGRDDRIIPLANKENNVWAEGDRWAGFLDLYSEDCRFTTLDADDEFKPDFLEKMLAFMHENDLEVAACGNDFIDVRTNRFKGVRNLEQNLILEGSGFDVNFPQYHQFMRTVWGKVYSLSELRKCSFNYKTSLIYGNDTQFSMETFLNARRVGILAESLYKYYIFPKSVSRLFDDRRILSDQVLFDVAHDYLTAKCGEVSSENLDFLFHVYLYAIEDTMKVLADSQIDAAEKLSALRDIMKNRHTQELVKWRGAGAEKNALFRKYAVWVLSQKEVYNSDGLEIAADILGAMGMYPSQIEGWEAGWVFLLLAKIKDRLTEQRLVDGVDVQIAAVASKTSILAGSDAGFLTHFREIVFSILQQDEKTALRQIEEAVAQETEIPDGYIEAFLALGLKLSTWLEYTDDFIYLKKLQISTLIDLSKPEKAIGELADWDEVLPNDPDFKEF
jgi:glycosyltransferase involved in cell wall biosynthesis